MCLPAKCAGSLEDPCYRGRVMPGRTLARTRRWAARSAVGTLACLVLFTSSTSRALVWPDVPERIERALSSPDVTTRRTAARDLGKLGKERAEPLVLRSLADADLDVRLAAAQTAVTLRLAAATEAVLPWLGDREPKARLAACEIAKVSPNPRAVPQLARALGDSDPQVRAAAADALGSHGSDDAVAPLLGKLDDPSPPVRIQVARALARLHDGRAVVPLVGKVQDSVPEVRQTVVRSLGALGDPRAVQALVVALRDVNQDVRIEALGSLGQLRGDGAVDAIASLLAERTPTVRQAAFAALGRIGSKASVAALVPALGTGDDANLSLERTPVRDALIASGSLAESALVPLLDRPPSPAAATSAAVVLGGLRAKGAERALVAGLRRGTVPLPAALRALAGAGTSASVAVVLEFVADENPLARTEALRTAALLLDPDVPDGRAVEPLTAALREGRLLPNERIALVELLGRTGAPRAASVLVPLVQNRDISLKLAAIDAIGALGPKVTQAPAPAAREARPSPDVGSGKRGAKDSVEEILGEALDDKAREVRLHAAMTLAKVGGEASREALLKRLEGSEETDRFAVYHALGGILERAPSENAVERLGKSLDLSAGAERDGLVEALARASLPSATERVVTQARADHPADDRRTALASLASHAAREKPAYDALMHALTDSDPSVRAEAAWALGTAGNPDALEPLAKLALSPDGDVAANAVASLGRLLGKAKRADRAAALLCPRVADGRTYVRANALVGLDEAQVVCADAGRARKVLLEDPSDDARIAAVGLVKRGTSPDDHAALERCATQDRTGAVAAKCRDALKPQAPVAGASVPGKSSAVTVYVALDGSTAPRPLASYALRYATGYVRTGVADRRGAITDPYAPSGWLELRKPLGAR
jgi:HEAT repeat protein